MVQIVLHTIQGLSSLRSLGPCTYYRYPRVRAGGCGHVVIWLANVEWQLVIARSSISLERSRFRTVPPSHRFKMLPEAQKTSNVAVKTRNEDTRAGTDRMTHTHTHDDYCNPLAHAPRVNDIIQGSRFPRIVALWCQSCMQFLWISSRAMTT